MFQLFSLCVRLVLVLSVLFCCGCAGLTKPALPSLSFFSPLKLDGPYDADIPAVYKRQLKTVNAAHNPLVPYVFLRIGSHFESLFDQKRCVHFYDRAISGFRQNGNTAAEGMALGRKISALARFGLIRQANTILDEAAVEPENHLPGAFVSYGRAVLHLHNGDYARAGVHFSQVLASCAGAPDDPAWLILRRDSLAGAGLARIAGGYLAVVAERLVTDDLDDKFYPDIRSGISETLSIWEQALAVNEKIKNTKVYLIFPEAVPAWLECDLLNYQGLSWGIAGRTEEALAHLEAAGKSARAAGYLLGQADSLLFVCHIHLLNKKDRGAARQALQSLVETAGRMRLVSYSVWAQLMQVSYARSEGDRAQALQAMTNAVALMEESFLWYPRQAGVRGSGFFDMQAMYGALVELQLAGGEEGKAFQTAERSKASLLNSRLLEELAQIDSLHGRDDGGAQLCHRQLSQEYIKLLTSGLFEDFSRRLQSVGLYENAFAGCVESLKNMGSPLWALYSLSIPEPAQLHGSMEQNITIFTYYVGRHSLYVWITSAKKFQFKEIPMSQEAVNRLADAYRSALIAKDKDAADEMAEKVYDAFLRPVIHFVDGDVIGLGLHGPLYRVPFASLRYVGAYLVDGFTMFYPPHAGMIEHSPRAYDMAKIKHILIVSDARCAGTEHPHPQGDSRRELAAVKRIFPQAEVFYYMDFAAAQMPSGSFDAIHWILFDCPGGEALDSLHLPGTLTKQRDSCPEAGDLFKLSLAAKTTFLSTCRPGKRSGGKTSSSTLTGAWLYAISSHVITQLWEVPDATRAVFMKFYYNCLKKSGDTAYSLRTAQNEMIQEGYGPSDWAAFIVTGRY